MSASPSHSYSITSNRIKALSNQLKESLNPEDDIAKAQAQDKMAGEDYKFMGWMGKDKNAIGNMVWEEFEPKTWTEDDVDIRITHSGICGSDCHVSTSSFSCFFSVVI